MTDLASDTASSDQTALDAVLAKTSAKDRTNIQKHLTALDTGDAAHAAFWRRLAETLATLAPLPVQAVGHTSVLFFVPDGKYRMQVFALEDQSDGRITIYLPDVLNEAIQKKVLKKTPDPMEFAIGAALRTMLRVEVLDAHNTPEPPTHVKNMLGWNRKALRVVIPLIEPNGPRVRAVAALCELAARHWADRLTPAQPVEIPPSPAPRAPRAKRRTA